MPTSSAFGGSAEGACAGYVIAPGVGAISGGPVSAPAAIIHEPEEYPGGFLWKRSFDVALLVIAAPILLPVMLLTALAIKLVSPGPVLFVQKRVGYRSQLFSCYKFRTMEVNAPVAAHMSHLPALVASGAPLNKLDRHDPRLIPQGRWIRATGLDELPQIWNILRGEMSLVGPRPCAEYELRCFEGEGRERFRSLPGLTGLWQVSGKNDTTFQEMVGLDLQYVRNSSVWLDLKIVAATPAVIIGQVFRLKARVFAGTPPKGGGTAGT